MKKKYLFLNLTIALTAAIIAVILYSRISEPGNGEQVLYQARHPAWFTSLPADHRPGQMNFTWAAEKTVHGVVHVTTMAARGTRNESDDPFDLFQLPGFPLQREGTGSGVIITSEGHIVTNYHVIQGAAEIEVTLNDGQSTRAEIMGSDPDSDIALLKINGHGLPYIEFGNSDELKVGEWVMAVGNPMNLTSSVTAGIVSAIARGLGVFQEREMAIESFIQTDAPVNPGSSGGALVNLRGELVGVPTLIISPTGTYSGNSFAIPVSIVRKVVDDIMEYGEVRRAILGVRISDIDSRLADETGLDRITGIYVNGLIEGGAAEEAGLGEGDVIIEVDGREVGSVAELQETISQYRPGDRVIISFIRNGETREVAVSLQEPDQN